MKLDSVEFTTRVIECLADADGLEPTELDYNLHDYIDPDVLRKLGEMERGTWEITFQVSDHQVTINQDGGIIIDGAKYN
ncbi:HalOD1 output domain-containing protein [Natrinema amylolyticum]|uniref:HalOD1 output domain-containing protein n=1 Tax=Natrinema amylolyticum TaxID=2878679 RepID=UPI001CFBD3C0|nr:HalOD1 output domain-containing protein [Natrinema amylolyticum]